MTTGFSPFVTARTKQDPEHFDSVTPFRASNVAKYTEKSLEEAAKPRGGFSVAYAGRPAPQEPPKSASNPPGGIDFKALHDMGNVRAASTGREPVQAAGVQTTASVPTAGEHDGE